MLRLSTQIKPRISSRLAIFAALTLVVTTLAGMDETVQGGQVSAHHIAGLAMNTIEQPASPVQSGSVVRKNKAFKMSLFLFRF
jgi:hypothetical protein